MTLTTEAALVADAIEPLFEDRHLRDARRSGLHAIAPHEASPALLAVFSIVQRYEADAARGRSRRSDHSLLVTEAVPALRELLDGPASARIVQQPMDPRCVRSGVIAVDVVDLLLLHAIFRDDEPAVSVLIGLGIVLSDRHLGMVDTGRYPGGINHCAAHALLDAPVEQAEFTPTALSSLAKATLKKVRLPFWDHGYPLLLIVRLIDRGGELRLSWQDILALKGAERPSRTTITQISILSALIATGRWVPPERNLHGLREADYPAFGPLLATAYAAGHRIEITEPVGRFTHENQLAHAMGLGWLSEHAAQPIEVGHPVDPAPVEA